MRYAEFAVTSNFSFLRGASHPEELMAQAARLGLSALGLADRNSVAGIVRAHVAKRESGLKLSFHPGARLVFADGTPDILAYPRDRAGWGKLCRLLTLGNRRAEKGDCILNLDDLFAHAEHFALIVMPQAAPRDDFAKLLARLHEAAPENVWLAAAMLYGGDDRARLAALAGFAQRAHIPLIAVNDVLYHAPERRPLQDVQTCIREHVTLETAGYRLAANAERHLKPPAEMARLFPDAPHAIAETMRLSERLKFSLDELKYDYPDETREGFATPQDALVHFTFAGAADRYPAGIPEKVKQSLDYELALIASLEYAPYFLTVHDIVRFARSRGILCQGRGSAANSAVCFCLGITEVDPDRIDLLFERFLSAERREPPDIDVDFEHERREEVIQYIYGRYGRERASLAATVISYRARSAIREVGKAFGLSEDSIGAVASSIWGSGGDDLATADLRGAGLNAKSPRVRKMLGIVAEILSFPRHLSQHVGGFVITRGRLDEVVPIQNAAMEDRTCVEWDKDDLDALGILKIDVLGLGMLTCLRKALDLVEKHYSSSLPPPLAGEVDAQRRQVYAACASLAACASGGGSSLEASIPPPQPSPASGGGRVTAASGGENARQHRFDLSVIPPEEPAVYRMLQRADSLGVFQVESRAQMTMLPRLKPKNFYDLVIEVAIVRPGPIQGDMVHPYLRRRQGLEPVTYPSRALEQVLSKTLGVPLFQEQAMKIAIVAAGFTPSQADRLRRAMATFRRVGTIGTFARKMIDGMIANGYERNFAENCFRQIEGFGEYGFPESHAASFALLVYASSWLKCRYPDVFAAALLNAQPMGFYAPAQIVRDVREHGVEVRPVDINRSDFDSTLEPGPSAAERVHELHRDMAIDIRARCAIRLGLREIKGLRQHDAKAIVAQRGRGYDSLRDLWLRTGLSPRVLERLADADAFGSLGLSRRDALWAVKVLGRAGDQDDLPLFRQAEIASPRVRGEAGPPKRSEGGPGEGALPPPERLDMPPHPVLAFGSDHPLPACGEREISREPEIKLPPMPLGEEVVNDYRFLKLSLRAHPAAFLRAKLATQNIHKNEELRKHSSSSRVKISGLVTVRQRPGTAKGVIFMTIEDETAVANIIVWPKIFERFRTVVLGARYIAITGQLQEESGVSHVVADRLDDLTHLLAYLAAEGTAIDGLARCDEVRRPVDDHRDKRLRPGRRTPLVALLADMPELAGDLDVPARATRHAIPKRKAR